MNKIGAYIALIISGGISATAFIIGYNSLKIFLTTRSSSNASIENVVYITSLHITYAAFAVAIITLGIFIGIIYTQHKTDNAAKQALPQSDKFKA